MQLKVVMVVLFRSQQPQCGMERGRCHAGVTEISAVDENDPVFLLVGVGQVFMIELRNVQLVRLEDVVLRILVFRNALFDILGDLGGPRHAVLL